MFLLVNEFRGYVDMISKPNLVDDKKDTNNNIMTSNRYNTTNNFRNNTSNVTGPTSSDTINNTGMGADMYD